jgi:hypothetical protein
MCLSLCLSLSLAGTNNRGIPNSAKVFAWEGAHRCLLGMVCVFITGGPIIKLCAGGEGDSEGHVL